VRKSRSGDPGEPGRQRKEPAPLMSFLLPSRRHLRPSIRLLEAVILSVALFCGYPAPHGESAQLLIAAALPLISLIALIPVFLFGNDWQRVAAAGLSFVSVFFLVASLGRIGSAVFDFSL
jgi:hypothetical protein